MGLGANEDGHCSSCDIMHLRPWGTQCLAYKEALSKCDELNLDHSDYKLYLDLNLLRYAKDVQSTATDEKGDIPADQLKALTETNLQQKKYIQSLLDQLADQKKLNPPPPPPRPPVDHGHILQQIVQRLDRLENRGVHPTGTPQPRPVTAAGASIAAKPTVHGASSDSDTAAVTAMGQMADAMAQLSLSIDPSSAKKAGQYLRPEYQYYVVEKGMPFRNADASKLSIQEFLYGMCLVMGHLVDIDGDWASYFAHFKRVMKFCVGKKYVNAAYVAYDKEVVDSYLKDPSAGFNASDSLAIPTHFCSANEHDTQNARSRGQRRPKQSDNRNRNATTMQSQPDDWPEEACFAYNNSSCNGTCGKQHICGRCLIRGHRVGSCRVKLPEKN